MANLLRWALGAVAATLLASACETPETATGLRPEGPPMVQQVFMFEIANNNGTLARQNILAHGWHPAVPNGRDLDGDGTPDEVDLTHPTMSAAAADQRIRVVLDELLIGNYLEEIACRIGGYSKVPEGATPDDIANCAVADDLLPAFCKGPYAVCLDPVTGAPNGVLDEDENGSPDNTQMIDGAVNIVCNGLAGPVPLNREASFWQPSGNQLIPAGGSPTNNLGPAIVLVPMMGRLPAASTCHIEFAPDITDKTDRNRPCVPTNGTEDTDDIGNCTEGDMSGFSFGTESIRLDTSSPSNNAMNIPVTRRTVSFFMTAPVDPGSAVPANVTFMAGAATRTDFTVTIPAANPSRIDVTLNVGAPNLAPATVHTVTITNLRDSFGVPVTGTFSTTFTTAP